MDLLRENLDLWNELHQVASALPDDFKFEVEDNGHTVYFETTYDSFTPNELLMVFDMGESLFNEHSARGLIEAWKTGKPITQVQYDQNKLWPERKGPPVMHYYMPIPFSVSRFLGQEKCSYCGHRDFYTDGFKIWTDRPCPLKDGIEVKVSIEVPSGKLLVGNDFRNEFPVKNDDFYVNELHEMARCTETYAEEGPMLHFFVGNSCPSIYRSKDDPNKLICANPIYEEDGDEDGEIEGYEKTGSSVCTDLWWVSIADYDEAAKRGLTTDGPGWTENDVVEVEPGTYVLDYHGLKKGFDRDANMDEYKYDPETRTGEYIKRDKVPVIYGTITKAERGA
jgi:hypothetical protein